jgi:hypothetical protein
MAQQPVSIILPATLLLTGARDVHGTIITIPGNALGAEPISNIYAPFTFPISLYTQVNVFRLTRDESPLVGFRTEARSQWL